VLVDVLVLVLVLVLDEDGDEDGDEDEDEDEDGRVGSGGIGSPSGSGTGFRVAGRAGVAGDGNGCGITSPGEVGHGTGSCRSSPHAERASASCT
jgi:hypothetical protein